MTQQNDNDDPPPGRIPVIGNPAFRNADFRRLLAASACSFIGMTGEQVIIGLLVFEITQSSAWVGTALALYYLPLLVAGPLAGAVSDWLDRRALLRRLEFAILTNLILFAGATAMGWVALWPILLFTAAAGSLRAMHSPVRTSYAYDIVGGKQIVASLGLLNLGTRLGALVGALVAGAAMENFGTPVALLALASAHGAGFMLLLRLQYAGFAAPVNRAPLLQNLREFKHELLNNRVLLMLILLTAAVELFGFSFSTAMPELAATRFNVGPEGLGLMHAARATGGIVASLALSAMGGLERKGTVFLVVIYAFGGSLILLSVSEPFALGLAALALVAVMATASDVLTQSMVQLSVANELRGRAMGTWSLAIGSAPLGHLIMGALAVAIGVGGALAINGAALIMLGLIATITVPALRKL
ncbi:MAG: MFS transporter [Alphaproteobacteria bacterium]